MLHLLWSTFSNLFSNPNFSFGWLVGFQSNDELQRGGGDDADAGFVKHLFWNVTFEIRKWLIGWTLLRYQRYETILNLLDRQRLPISKMFVQIVNMHLYSCLSSYYVLTNESLFQGDGGNISLPCITLVEID